MSQAKDISLALTARLETITAANGYLTDIGAKVFRGRRRLDESNIPCCVIAEGDDNILDENRRAAKIEQQYFIEGHSICNPDNPNDKAHDIIEDIKRAIFKHDAPIHPLIKALSYKGRTINPRDDGAGVIAASVEIAVTMVETLDAP